MLGSFPLWDLRSKILLTRKDRWATTSWNRTLAYSIARLPSVEILFVSAGAAVKREQSVRLADHLTLLTLPYGRVHRSLDLVQSFYQLRERIRTVCDQFRPHLVHGVGSEHPYAFLASRLGRPAVVTVHGIARRLFVVQKSAYYGVLAVYESLAVRDADAIIAVNEYASTTLQSWNLSAFQRVVVIPNPLARPFQASDPTTWPVRRKRRIAFVGTVTREKGIFDLVRIVAEVCSQPRYEDFECVIVGRIPRAKTARQLKTEIGRRRLGSTLKLTGTQSQAEVARILASSRVLILPSKQETAPMVISEALACGASVVSYDVGGVRKMLESVPGTDVVPLGNVHEFAQRVAKRINDFSTEEAIERRVVSLSRHDAEKVARSTRRVYDFVAGNEC